MVTTKMIILLPLNEYNISDIKRKHNAKLLSRTIYPTLTVHIHNIHYVSRIFCLYIAINIVILIKQIPFSSKQRLFIELSTFLHQFCIKEQIYNAYIQTRFVSIVSDLKCNYNNAITNRNY